MIQIVITIADGKIYDKLCTKETTVIENSMAVRALESMKKNLLEIEYKSDISIEEEPEDSDDF